MERQSWQYLLPLLFPLAVLLYLYQFLGSNSSSPEPMQCGENSVVYSVKPDESCWAIASERGVTVADLMKLNPHMDCEVLKVGEMICVPSVE
ncbi:uncharacterized protein LY89DRAFT_691170 [Mollisia scopiformis]|uniref:LysM domain-containing protein n=1 Tax=Mollisia scopiformis TaxID=149040 RepID=A0A132B7S6_MOLSC|nr:uncharacterized protein LY89DRAFT_691170 [Mollisia scopiformis]KUJ08303.1 hypothetical protein LY89DRAFT_691170 [Mollisia scopiformis]